MKNLILLLMIFSIAAFKQDQKARFVGNVVVEFLDNGRQMRLMNDFAFIDAKLRYWHVPAGHIVDGASIPKPFWSIIGGPFEGKYRRASVVHDFYCDLRFIHWREVHRMFYEACITEGLDEISAKIMYVAVYSAGPRWEFLGIEKEQSVQGPNLVYKKTEEIETKVKEKAIEEAQEWIKKNNPSLDEIEKKVNPNVESKSVKIERTEVTEKLYRYLIPR